MGAWGADGCSYCMPNGAEQLHRRVALCFTGPEFLSFMIGGSAKVSGRDVFMAECIGVTFLEIIPCVAPDNIDSHQRRRQARMVHRNSLPVETGTAARRYLACIAV